MAGPYTTLANLLDGVGEFPKQSENLLLELLPIEDREKGLTDGLTDYHAYIWERLSNDASGQDGVDLTGDLTTAQETLVRAICCHMLMAHLYLQNSLHAQDQHMIRYKFHKAEYQRIRGRLYVVMGSGRTANVGCRNRVVRA